MTMINRYLTTYMLALSFFVAELHSFWHMDNVVENWIIFADYPMTRDWNVKYATDQVLWLMMGIALFAYRPNRINHTSATVFLLWVIVDMVMYFFNYKQGPYGMIYFALAGIWILIYLWKTPARK